jgi:hypothetical protein
MSLFHSQTIFNILITLIICSAMFIFFRFKLRVLEISQREQAKVLQSLVMSMRNGGHQQNMVSDDEIMKHMQMQVQMQQGGAGAGAGLGAGGPGNQNRHPNDLIDVSDDDEDEDDDESESSSDSEDDETDSSSSEDENEENHENTTKKIIFNNGGALDAHAHPIEHLTGDDIKVIELTEPLYPVGAGSKHDNDNNISDDDGDDDDDGNDGDDNDNMSDDDDDNDDEETSDDTEVKIEKLPIHASVSLSHGHEQHLETSVIDTTEIKTIFKADKQQQQQQQQQHTDYNSMNVQALKQHLKTKLSAEGMHYNETAIHKLNKKELIKHLTQ